VRLERVGLELRGDRFYSFNVSHSRGAAFYAMARGQELGIDLEYLSPYLAADEQSAEKIFSRPELAMLRGLPVDRQQKAFLACWTRKEAYINVRGEVLALRLSQFGVSWLQESLQPCSVAMVTLKKPPVGRSKSCLLGRATWLLSLWKDTVGSSPAVNGQRIRVRTVLSDLLPLFVRALDKPSTATLTCRFPSPQQGVARTRT
jgi:hypothetical protein